MFLFVHIESPPDSAYGSYADACTSDFFDAIIQADAESTPKEKEKRRSARNADAIEYVDAVFIAPTDAAAATAAAVDEKQQLASIKAEASAFSKNHLKARL
jgi:hypothetical protein